MFKPFGTRVLVLRHKPKEVSEGGVFLAAGAQRPPHTGTVLAVGSECRHVSVGDEVYFPNHAGAWITVVGAPRDEQYVVLREEDLLGMTVPTSPVGTPDLETL